MKLWASAVRALLATVIFVGMGPLVSAAMSPAKLHNGVRVWVVDFDDQTSLPRGIFHGTVSMHDAAWHDHCARVPGCRITVEVDWVESSGRSNWQSFYPGDIFATRGEAAAHFAFCRTHPGC